MKNFLLIFLSTLLFNIQNNETRPRLISGNIIDENGNPLEAVIRAGEQVTKSDAGGNYQISIKNETSLHFTAPGFFPQKITIGHSLMYNVVMKSIVARKEFPILQTPQVRLKAMDVRSAHMQYSTRPSPGIHPQVKISDNYNTEEYASLSENGFKKVEDHPLSTFSIDVDAASYSNVRRFIQNGKLPPAGAVRTEELINYFHYDFPQPEGEEPFTINTMLSQAPWNKENQLLMIGMQGKTLPPEDLPASNLVFLIDVSGSMSGMNRLPLVKRSLEILTDQLRPEDRISIVVYAGKSGVELHGASGDQKKEIKETVQKLEAGGFTAGGAGIQLAYKMAAANFVAEGNNRVILCTDGDFNIGPSSDDELVRIIEKEKEKGVFLTVLGYGMGNYKDSKMQLLAQKGNGNHAYIDGIDEARKVLVTEFGGTLFTIASDVKIQVEFNPEKVAGYRLLGYENRLLSNEDFNDDKKDAGELGSGHTVTALYEIIPVGTATPFLKSVDPLKYQKTTKDRSNIFKDEVVTIKTRYKIPQGKESKLSVHAVKEQVLPLEKTDDNFRFAASVAGFGMLLTNSEFKGEMDFKMARELAKESIGHDEKGYRKEYLSLISAAENLQEGRGD